MLHVSDGPRLALDERNEARRRHVAGEPALWESYSVFSGVTSLQAEKKQQ